MAMWALGGGGPLTVRPAHMSNIKMPNREASLDLHELLPSTERPSLKSQKGNGRRDDSQPSVFGKRHVSKGHKDRPDRARALVG